MKIPTDEEAQDEANKNYPIEGYDLSPFNITRESLSICENRAFYKGYKRALQDLANTEPENSDIIVWTYEDTFNRIIHGDITIFNDKKYSFWNTPLRILKMEEPK